METLNNALFLIINADEQSPKWLIHLSIFLAEWMIYLIPIIFIYMWISGDGYLRRTTVMAVLSVSIALCVGQIVNLIFPHPRPFMIGLGHTFLSHTPESSFPSDHAIVFFASALSFLLTSIRKWGALLLLIGTIVSWSRVYLGVHFPFDIAGSLLVSIPSVFIVQRVFCWHDLGCKFIRILESMYDGVTMKIRKTIF